MGLTVTVGVPAEGDGAAEIEADMKAINAALKEAGHRTHKEPGKGEVWSADGYFYYGLHAAREVAARLVYGEPIPRDRPITGKESPTAERHYAELLERLLEAPAVGFLKRLFGGGPALHDYAHLACHSDAEGYYVPVDFKAPVIPREIAAGTKHLWPLGSSQRLLDETTRLARALEIPEGMGHGDAELQRWLEGADDTPEALWQAHPIAAYSCLMLREAAQRSVAAKAAIRFC
ncbi:hypothetical protein [Ovoidimarina sediminis]|uniref:hypothetical protein n=1 Tax=Ovoidimarina sediminis TaxID=3079856 RepID=UPI00290881AD|nr:hypothetical protein [Rhodophyticola sp. MJ-SS7]MDU8946620.1 hypothetical protein [Rhodophyticola sp. MJ-SS7]